MKCLPLTLTVGLLACASLNGAEQPNVILVSFEQLRADRLHSYGNPRQTSPNLDRMAAEGVRFSHFYSAAPWSGSSYGAIMTSLAPSRHGLTVYFPQDQWGYPSNTNTLAELFQKAGYKTAAFVNLLWLTARGFDEFNERQLPRSGGTRRPGIIAPSADPGYRAPAVTDSVLDWLDKNRKEPFFLFVLYWEPHSPYDPPAEHDLFQSDAYPKETNTGWDLNTGRLFRWANLGDQKAIERLHQLYDGSLHLVDSHFGRLLDRLRETGLVKNTIVLVTSNNGELLYDHPEDYLTFDHRSLYESVLHVPAILWGGGVPAGKTVGAMAATSDIAPTLLELAGLPRKDDAQGESLVPLIQEKKASIHSHVFGEVDIVEPLRAVRDDRYKLIRNLRSGRQQLFDYRADPQERFDLSSIRPDLLEALGEVLDRWRNDNEPPAAERIRKWQGLARELVIDEVTTASQLQLIGPGWKMADHEKNLNGGCYWTESFQTSKIRNVALWRGNNPLLGTYRVSIWYGALPDGRAASDARFTVVAGNGSQEFRIDQSVEQGKWRELGLFKDPIYVLLSNEANGPIVVDAVKFEWQP